MSIICPFISKDLFSSKIALFISSIFRLFSFSSMFKAFAISCFLFFARLSSGCHNNIKIVAAPNANIFGFNLFGVFGVLFKFI